MREVINKIEKKTIIYIYYIIIYMIIYGSGKGQWNTVMKTDTGILIKMKAHGIIIVNELGKIETLTLVKKSE